MKFLCVCEGGNTRSVALAYVLKDFHHQNAVAMGWRDNSPEPIGMVAGFADYIIVMQPEFAGRIPEAHRAKVRVLDVGPDRWGNPMHPEIQAIVSRAAQEWAAKDFKI